MTKSIVPQSDEPRTGKRQNIGWRTRSDLTVNHHFYSVEGVTSAVSPCGVVADKIGLLPGTRPVNCPFCETADLLKQMKGGEKS